MIQTVKPGARFGKVRIPSSKSFAHRMLICAAMADRESTLFCDGISQDIQATVDCLKALGAKIESVKTGKRTLSIHICPITAKKPQEKKKSSSESSCILLPVKESGSTLRFLLPLVGALGVGAEFAMEGRLPDRPLSPFDDLLRAHGMCIVKDGTRLICSGKLESGIYDLPGNISSQFISGLLMSLPYLEHDSILQVRGVVESEGYVRITTGVLNQAGIVIEKDGCTYGIPGKQQAKHFDSVPVEGDWSNAAFFLAAGSLSMQGVTVDGLNERSLQGDSEVFSILSEFGSVIRKDENRITVKEADHFPLVIDATLIPDLIPVLSVLACSVTGETKIINASRLRLKESDRLKSTAQLIASLGGSVDELPDGLVIHGTGKLIGGTVDPYRDHRLAMSAAVAACICSEEVTVLDAECVEKSYPDFWKDFSSLGIN